jgi:hypothetical protein
MFITVACTEEKKHLSECVRLIIVAKICLSRPAASFLRSQEQKGGLWKTVKVATKPGAKLMIESSSELFLRRAFFGTFFFRKKKYTDSKVFFSGNLTDAHEPLNAILACTISSNDEQATGNGNVAHEEDGIQTLCIWWVVPE